MKIIILHIALLYSLISYGQKFEAVLEREEMKIGEQITLQLLFEYPGNQGQANILWPEINDTVSQQLEVIKKGQQETKVLDPDQPLMQQQQNFIITSFDTGYIVVPPFEVLYNDSSYETTPSLLHVMTVEVDTSKGIADIKPIYDVEYSMADRMNDLFKWLKDNWYIPATVLAALIAFILLYRRWKKKQNQPEEKIQLPAHVIALQSLDDLDNKKLWIKGQTKEHFVELIQIIRIYIENRYGVRAREKTTQEIINGLKFESITEEQKGKLRNLLSLADLVKFAKEQPLDEDNENSLKKAYEFVEETKFSEEDKERLRKQIEDFNKNEKE